LVASGTNDGDDGNETITFNVPAGAGGTYYIQVTSDNFTQGEYFLQKFIGAAISGTKFNDLNGDGVREAGEPGLSGWSIDALDSGGNLVASTVTDASGNYSFSNLAPGTYTIEEVLQAGWTQTDPASPGTYTIVAASAGTYTGNDFGNFHLVSISGTVYNDINGNGVRNKNQGQNEPGLSGWTVNLL